MRNLPILLFALLPTFVLGQENRYMVFFTDKEESPYSVDEPVQFLSAKAIERRLEQGIDVTLQDIPVKASYVAGVRDAGAATFFTTRWMNGVLVECDASIVPDIESLTYVDRVELVAPGPQLEAGSGGRRSFNFRRKKQESAVETEVQLAMLGIDKMHAAGYQGQGIVVAILDSGFPGVNQIPAFQHVFSENRFMEEVSYDFVHNAADVFTYDDHGTEVFSVIAGQVADAYTGGAYEATFQLFITEDVPTEYRIEEYNWLFAAEKADSAGADIIHSSLGYYDFDDAAMNYTRAQMDGETAIVTQAAQLAGERGMVVVTSAGNEGAIAWGIVTAPADGRDVLAIGAVNHNLQRAASSSTGPTADGRIKPDLAALGTGVKVVQGNGQISTSSGTSLAAPLVTSLVAGIWQRYPDLAAQEVIALLKETASQANNPDNFLGYGIPNFKAVVNYQERSPQTSPFEVFPNPLTADTLTIRPLDPDVIESAELEILTVAGQLVGRRTIHFNWLDRAYQADLSDLSAGVYFVRLLHEKRRYTFRLVRL